MTISKEFSDTTESEIININTGNPYLKKKSKKNRKKKNRKMKERWDSQFTFKSTHDNKENIQNSNQNYFPTQYQSSYDQSSISNVNLGDEYPTEVYQSMQGFQKPRILKYSLQISQVSWGESHMAFITDWGHLYTMGNNEKGKLGLGDMEIAQTTVPSLVEFFGDSEVIQVSCGKHHTAWVTQEGIAYTWGEGKYGALGQDFTQNTALPQSIGYLSSYKIKVTKVSCGWYHTCFLSKNEDVFIAGVNSESPESKISFIQIPEKWCDISWGEKNALILTKSGFVYSVNFSSKASFHPIKIKSLETEFVSKISWNKYWAAITDEGILFVWGNSILGNFENPEKIEWIPKSVKDVSLGYCLSGCIDASGLIWAWGKNSHGELGVGDWNKKTNPYPVMSLKQK